MRHKWQALISETKHLHKALALSHQSKREPLQMKGDIPGVPLVTLPKGGVKVSYICVSRAKGLPASWVLAAAPCNEHSRALGGDGTWEEMAPGLHHLSLCALSSRAELCQCSQTGPAPSCMALSPIFSWCGDLTELRIVSAENLIYCHYLEPQS